MIGVLRDERGIARYDLPKPSDLVASLRATVAASPDSQAFIDRGRGITWREFGDEVDLLAGRLRAEGIAPGDRVAVLAGNGVPYSVAVYAIWRAGAIAVPLNHRLTAADLARLLADSGAALLLVGTDQGDLGAATSAASGVRATPADADGRFLTACSPTALDHGDPGPAAPAAIMYTSGTTGLPKGVVITHGNAIENSLTCIAAIGRRSDDRELIMVPQFNITGLCSQTVPAVQLGMTIITMGPFDADAALAAIGEHGATSTVGAPTMWWWLLDAAEATGSTALGSLRLALYGGAPMPTALLARMRAAMPSAGFGNGYGQTETCSMVTYLGGDDALRRPESVGRPLPLTDLRILDPETAADMPPGEPGEIVVRGGQISAGYWTAEGIRPIADPDGWVRTGDIGVVDDDGVVVLRDRIKDVIKRGGESVFSFEVEECLAQHPDVMEVAVLGLPDPEYGETVVAAVVLKPGADAGPDDLRAHCSGSLARFKVPRRFEFFDVLPRNPGGKVMKADLRTRLTETRTTSR